MYSRKIGGAMKYKCLFAMVLILSALFLIGAAAAGETVSHDANSTGDAYLSVDESSIFDSDSHVVISADEGLNDSAANADLSVEMKIGDVKKNTFAINQISFDVPLIITAKASDGIAKNAKVLIIMPEEFKFVSYDVNRGSYGFESGTWAIGDLDSGEVATLTILTSINKKGNYLISVNSTVDSDDDLTNNCLECSIEVTSKISSNVTRTSADRNSVQHTTHYGSMAKGINKPEFKEDAPSQPENPSSDDPNKKTNDPSQHQGGGKKGGNGHEQGNGKKDSEGSQEESSSNTVSKMITAEAIANAVTSIEDTIGNILNSESGNGFFDPSRIVKAIRASDYITIPILIFALFLIGVIGELAYEKIKA